MAMHFDTKAIHAGGEIDEETGALAPPINLSTTFERDDHGQPTHGFSYIRDGNPTQARLEKALAAIDSAAGALAFASGMSAASCLLQALPKGAHVLLPEDGYYALRTLQSEFFPRWGLTSTSVDMSDQAAVAQVLQHHRQTKLIWAETPSNPLMKVCSLIWLSERAKDAGAMLVVDGTFATPALQRPIELGADVVLHSTTKYLGGHSDVQGGSAAFAARDAYFEAVEHVRKITGGVASPFNSWLVLRGIRTLAVRMQRHSSNAMAVALFLESHARVEKVHFPWLESDPGHGFARQQMSAPGGMLSFRVKGGREAALGVASKTKLFIRATSLGGVESLVEHRESSEGPGSTTAPNLLRLSVGLENAEDLIDDLRQALE